MRTGKIQRREGIQRDRGVIMEMKRMGKMEMGGGGKDGDENGKDLKEKEE